MPTVRVFLWQEHHWFVAQCADVDVASQGGSADHALENLKEALSLHRREPSPGYTFELSIPDNAEQAWLNL